MGQDLESLLTVINQGKVKLDILRQSLDNATIKEALRVEFSYESNRIEGNTLTLRETQLVINEGMTISGKSMREHLEAINHKEAISSCKFFIDFIAIVVVKALFLRSTERAINGLFTARTYS